MALSRQVKERIQRNRNRRVRKFRAFVVVMEQDRSDKPRLRWRDDLVEAIREKAYQCYRDSGYKSVDDALKWNRASFKSDDLLMNAVRSEVQSS